MALIKERNHEELKYQEEKPHAGSHVMELAQSLIEVACLPPALGKLKL